jgi:hypothetical protein
MDVRWRRIGICHKGDKGCLRTAEPRIKKVIFIDKICAAVF